MLELISAVPAWWSCLFATNGAEIGSAYTTGNLLWTRSLPMRRMATFIEIHGGPMGSGGERRRWGLRARRCGNILYRCR